MELHCLFTSLCLSLHLGVFVPQTQSESRASCGRGVSCATRAQGLSAEEGTAGDFTHVNPIFWNIQEELVPAVGATEQTQSTCCGR